MSLSFPPALMVEGRRLPVDGVLFRRLARAVDLQAGERVVLVGAGAGHALPLLAQEFGAQVVALEWETVLQDALQARIRDDGLTGRVAVRGAGLAGLPEGNFEVVLLDAPPPPGPLTGLAAALRPLLGPNGRIGLTFPCAVGVATSEAVQTHWSAQTGQPLARPWTLLAQLERAGFDPQWAESIDPGVLEGWYGRLEGQLGTMADVPAELGARARSEIELWRHLGGRTGFSYAMLAARRREPDEKPAPSRGGA